MEWNEFQELNPGDRVMTEKYGEATVHKWINDKKSSIVLCDFTRPVRHCPDFYRTEIKCKL
jgi:hypothetical protein